MNAQIAQADLAPLDRSFAVSWYDEWLDCWNSNRPEVVREILTEDFVVDSPTTRHSSTDVRDRRCAHVLLLARKRHLERADGAAQHRPLCIFRPL